MRFRKVINEPIESDENGVKVAGGVNAVIEANIGESGPSRSHTSSKQSIRVVQRGGETHVEERTETSEGEPVDE